MIEEWKDIPGFEGWYQASTCGRIKSISRKVNYKSTSSSLATKSEHLLSPKKAKTGYLEVTLVKNGEIHYCRVHRLVASTFLANPTHLPYVNHIDENKTNNCISNLEWCTCKQNNDAYYTQRIIFYQYDLKGNLIAKCDSLTNTAVQIGGDKTGIQHCCTGKLKTYLGFIFTYQLLTKEDLVRRTTNKVLTKVVQFDLKGNEIARYNSAKEAAATVGCNQSAISLACAGKRKTIKGYIWKYEKSI